MAYLANLRRSIRTLARAPGFAAIAILTIALGVGANTAIFSVVNGVLLRPLPFRDPERLVAISESRHSGSNVENTQVNAMHFLEWRRRLHSFQALSLLDGSTKNLTGSGEPERLIGVRVSANLFPLLGIKPALGRLLREEEDRPGTDHVVLLSHSLWVRRFGGNPAILRQTIRLDGEAFQVVGVLPANLPRAGTAGVDWSAARTDFWVPFALRNDELFPYGDFDYDCIGLLRPGVSLPQAAAELNALQAQIAKAIPEKVDLEGSIKPLSDTVTGNYRPALLLLSGAVGVILLIACANIANLLLARAAGRSREFAIRVAVGASQKHLFGQSMAESGLLAMLGGALGLLVCYLSFGFLTAHVPQDIPRSDEIRIDGHVLLFAFFITSMTGILCGILPGWRYVGTDPQEALKTGSHNLSEAKHKVHLRSLLVSAEVALSTVSLMLLGLLLHSFIDLLHVHRGFDVQHVLTANVSLSGKQYLTLEHRKQFWQNLLPKIEALPGVLSVGISNRLPLTGSGTDNWIIPEGKHLELSDRPVADMRFVNPGYFSTLGVSIDKGRDFYDTDAANKVAVISAKTAQALFGMQDPVGRRFHMGDEDSPLITVVGIAGDVRANGLEQAPKFTLYIPYWQRDRTDMSLAVRTASDPSQLAAAVLRNIRSADGNLPVPSFQTMTEVLDSAVASRRFQVLLLIIFGGLALLLASLGIYGVVSYSVNQRQVELGIRLALGAQPSQIAILVLEQGMLPVLFGLVAGIMLAFWAGSLIGSLLFGVSTHDPATLAAVALTLSIVALLACGIPILRTLRIDPLQALKYE